MTNDPKHCWHQTGNTMRCNGALFYVCCHCGREAWGTAGYQMVRPAGHGPFAPEQRVQMVNPPNDAGPCIPPESKP